MERLREALLALVSLALGYALGRRHSEAPMAAPAPRLKRKGARQGREVICGDALQWIEALGRFPERALVFTSLPDISEVLEFAKSFEEWEAFFMKAAV